MKQINVFEFKDLEESQQKLIRQQTINETVESDIELLGIEFAANRLAKEKYYDALGCSEHYAETTPWFVSSCYYDKNEKDILRRVELNIRESLYTENGTFIQYSFETK